MSDRMHPYSFEQLFDKVFSGMEKNGNIFGIRDFYRADKSKTRMIFNDEKIETPFGPAAGPHTQLADNIIAAYLTGSRFFELKTVQKLDGEDLPVSKPCIEARDEGYNVEWSTELRVPEAFEEYVKAWIIIHILAKEYDLGSPDGFVFNMSVGYDLDGIKTEKIDNFIENLKDAKNTDIFNSSIEYAINSVSRLKNVSVDDIKSIPSQVCNSVTISTLHGCPPEEIEKIASYMLKDKHLNTFVKCNPTLLGYDFARKTLDSMGYDYISFDDGHFKTDLQYEDAVPMLTRLMKLSEEEGLEFGVKITNTFPVDIKCNELPGNEMYMSGRSLYPLSISLAAKLSRQFDGRLRISYSGGADAHNIENIVNTGIWPVTMATTMLKPGGYMRLSQIGDIFTSVQNNWNHTGDLMGKTVIDTQKLDALATSAITDSHHIKSIKPLPDRKSNKPIPIMDCFVAPCNDSGCPIHQDITAYMKLTQEGKYEEALQIVMNKNPLPFITGTICAHRCMSKCTRNFIDSPVNIRRMKLEAAEGGYNGVFGRVTAPEISKEEKIAIVGGGPAGLVSAYFLRKEGYDVTIFSDRDKLGGTVRNVIPGFRISDDAIDKDVSFIKKMGVKIEAGVHISSLKELDKYDRVILCMGAPKKGELKLEGDEVTGAIEFLAGFKACSGRLGIGEEVVVIGGGNTAMDTARAALRTEGVSKVSLVYRRSKRYMPADESELIDAIKDGVEFLELMSPVKYKDGILTLEVMRLGEVDSSGRRSPEPTGEYRRIKADMVIAAVGEHVDSDFYRENGIEVNEKGLPVVSAASYESSVKNTYIAGDGRKGPATVVEAIADAIKVCEAICGHSLCDSCEPEVSRDELYSLKGNVGDVQGGCDYSGCLNCAALCENCVDVCPNRANVEVIVPGHDMPQILHVDRLCNECGNCRSFCPYSGAPYLDKLTLFEDEESLLNSNNNGFAFTDDETGACIIRLNGEIIRIEKLTELHKCEAIDEIADFIKAVFEAHI